MILSYIIAILAIAAGLTALSHFLNDRIFTALRKVAALILSSAAFCRCMIFTARIASVDGRNMYTPFGSENIAQTMWAVILVWFTYAALLSIVLDQFFDITTLKHVTRYFSAPVLILDLIFFNTYCTAIVDINPFANFDFRLPLIAAEISLGLFLVYSQIRKKGHFIPTGKEWLYLPASVLLAIVSTMPSYVPKAFIGTTTTGDIEFFGLSEAHRFAVYLAFIIPFALYHILKYKSYDIKRVFLIYMSIGTLWSYLSTYPISGWFESGNWPLHLCTLAMFTIPLSLILKLSKLCYFGLYVSVVGALFMMFHPSVDHTSKALSSEWIAFWINHYAVFSLPMLIVSLGIFKRPKLKEWVWSTVIFTVYFITALIANAWLVNYFADTDFFFLNGNYIVNLLGEWAQNIKAVEWSVSIGGTTLTFYPAYQILYYLVYVAISALMWLCFKFLFNLLDNAENRRQKERDYKLMKLELKKFLGEKAKNTGSSTDNAPSIVLKGFTKRYGKNKHYSVDHVSFKVRPGEIFGFLGPNGAGKSTIIKSIVGIQNITAGNIEICGYDVERESVQAKLNTGFVPDHYALYENLTGREYINYIADLYDVDKTTRDETIGRYVDRFQLNGSFDNPMKTYSHGMKQKIAIMAALVHDPKVWILDEPLTGLDPNSIHEVKECMKEHAAKGNIVFFSSHIIDVVEKICDKIAVIKKGKLRAVATVAALDERGIDLEELYLDIIHADENAPLINIDGDDILNIDSPADLS